MLSVLFAAVVFSYSEYISLIFYGICLEGLVTSTYPVSVKKVAK